MIFAVDLAAKFSGAVILNSAGEVVDEFHSWQLTPAKWANLLTRKLRMLPEDTLVFVEDMPFSVGQTKTVRDVYRLQGRIIQLFHESGSSHRIVWVPPNLWQGYYKSFGMRSGDKKQAKVIAFEHYGYSPPELLHKDLHGKDRVDARKTMEDHIDAFLIARYVLEQSQYHGSVSKAVDAIPRLERYEG